MRIEVGRWMKREMRRKGGDCRLTPASQMWLRLNEDEKGCRNNG